MKFSELIISTAFVLVGAIVFAEASKYNSQNSYANSNQHHRINGYASNGGSYGISGSYGVGCHNYNCNNNNGNSARHQSAYGPYHSYAVRPAIYGGHGMYQYRGYARQPQGPATTAHYRAVRSYGTSGCTGSYCGSAHYNMRPVKAIALAPASYGSAGGSYVGQGQRAHHSASGYRQAHRNNGYAGQGTRHGGYSAYSSGHKRGGARAYNGSGNRGSGDSSGGY